MKFEDEEINIKKSNDGAILILMVLVSVIRIEENNRYSYRKGLKCQNGLESISVRVS